MTALDLDPGLRFRQGCEQFFSQAEIDDLIFVSVHHQVIRLRQAIKVVLRRFGIRNQKRAERLKQKREPMLREHTRRRSLIRQKRRIQHDPP